MLEARNIRTPVGHFLCLPAIEMFPFTDTWLNKFVSNWLPYLILLGLFVSAYIAQSATNCPTKAQGAAGGWATIFVPRLAFPRLMG